MFLPIIAEQMNMDPPVANKPRAADHRLPRKSELVMDKRSAGSSMATVIKKEV